MTFGGLYSHQLLSCNRPTFLHKNQWMYCTNLSCWFRNSVGARMGQPDTRWLVALCVYHILCIVSQHHFLICLLESFSLVGSGHMLLWWSPQSQISDPTKIANDGSEENYISVASTNRRFSVNRLIFPSIFQFLDIFSSCLCLNLLNLLNLFFTVDEEFSEMLSVLRLISFKYFFVS